eukprot:1160535-Pelagomonas_calceolata.AAC.13
MEAGPMLEPDTPGHWTIDTAHERHLTLTTWRARHLKGGAAAAGHTGRCTLPPPRQRPSADPPVQHLGS